MSEPFVSIQAGDLRLLEDCHRALADLVHVLETEPPRKTTTADLREAWKTLRNDAIARAQVSLEVAEHITVEIDPVPVQPIVTDARPVTLADHIKAGSGSWSRLHINNCE